ncbi:MAG: hydrogenase maturation peptidase HycI [Methanobacterium sp.]
MISFLKNHDKIAILGIGNEIKGDDGLGPFIAKKLSIIFHDNEDIAVFDGGTVPENYTGAIREINPTHIILVDAVEMGKEPGFIRVVCKEEIANYNISTHAMPISFLIKFMETTIGSNIILIGIQPKSMELAGSISKDVKNSIEEVINTLINLIR